MFYFWLQEDEAIIQKNNNLNEYYESLRNNVISLLENVRLPNCDEKLSPDNFDSYIAKLQTLCVDSYHDDNKPLRDTVKQALQDFAIPIWEKCPRLNPECFKTKSEKSWPGSFPFPRFYPFWAFAAVNSHNRRENAKINVRQKG